MYCEKCGKEVENDSRFCPYCGAGMMPTAMINPASVSENNQNHMSGRNGNWQGEPYYQHENAGFNQPYGPAVSRQNMYYEPQYQQPPVYSGVPIRNYNPNLDYNPIGMWGYFFYTILLNIPIIGWICIILFSLGVTKNVNLRNYARSWFCGYIIALIIVIINWWPYIELMLEQWMQ